MTVGRKITLLLKFNELDIVRVRQLFTLEKNAAETKGRVIVCVELYINCYIINGHYVKIPA